MIMFLRFTGICLVFSEHIELLMINMDKQIEHTSDEVFCGYFELRS